MNVSCDFTLPFMCGYTSATVNSVSWVYDVNTALYDSSGNGHGTPPGFAHLLQKPCTSDNHAQHAMPSMTVVALRRNDGLRAIRRSTGRPDCTDVRRIQHNNADPAVVRLLHARRCRVERGTVVRLPARDPASPAGPAVRD